ncbi:MAG: nuclear transport factor 2 family protein [Acidimicrobiales bacterium]|nr:nuclear transport factor 2 family protein [Acidimicrobiales bacterium]
MDTPTLSDRSAIIDLTARYCWALDQKNWADLDHVFTPDATADLGRGGQKSRDEIVARIRSSLDPLDDSQHMVSTHAITIDGDTATSRCYLHAQHVLHGTPGGELFVAAGRYEDDLIRTADGWRIKHRALTIMWTDGNRAVMESGKEG